MQRVSFAIPGTAKYYLQRCDLPRKLFALKISGSGFLFIDILAY